MDSCSASQLRVFASSTVDRDSIREQAYAETLDHMYSLSPDYSVIEQSDELYFDCATATRYCRVFTEYCTSTGAYGAFVTHYSIDNGGNDYEA